MIDHEGGPAAVHREAFEELGVALDCLEFVERVWSSPAVSTERQSLFLAPYRLADRIGKDGRLNANIRGFRVIERSRARLSVDVDQGQITDGRLLTLSLTLRLRQLELFIVGERFSPGG